MSTISAVMFGGPQDGKTYAIQSEQGSILKFAHTMESGRIFGEALAAASYDPHSFMAVHVYQMELLDGAGGAIFMYVGTEQ